MTLGKIIFSCLIPISCIAHPLLHELSIEEKVGQILMVHFNGENVNEAAKTLIQSTYVGGIIYYNWANGLINPDQVSSLSRNLQSLTKENRNPIPLLIAVDQEGGAVNRLNKGFTVFPGNKALAMSEDPELANLSAFATAQELLSVGVNMNLAPVVDINNNPKNPVIGIRSFGDLTESFISFAKNAIEGYHNAGMITSLKHFPGHGDVELDSHENLPLVKKTKEQLKTTELFPFFSLANDADTIMTAHIIMPAIDSYYCATLSKDVLSILRDEIGFKGVIISDSLVMEGILKNCPSIDEAAILAFNAGCDMLILGGKQLVGYNKDLELTLSDMKRIHTNLVQAVQSGRITEERLNEAVSRILDLKKQYHLFQETAMPKIEEIVRSSDHLKLAEKIASLALQVIENKPIHILDSDSIHIIAPKMVQEAIESSLLTRTKTNICFFNELNPTSETIEDVLKQVANTDVIICFSYNSWKYDNQFSLINSLLNLEKQTVIIAAGDPLDASLFPSANRIIITFSPSLASIQEACNMIKKMY